MPAGLKSYMHSNLKDNQYVCELEILRPFLISHLEKYGHWDKYAGWFICYLYGFFPKKLNLLTEKWRLKNLFPKQSCIHVHSNLHEEDCINVSKR